MGSFDAATSQTSQKKSSKNRIRGKAGKKRKANHGDKGNEIQEAAIELATTNVDEAMVYLTTVTDDMLHGGDS